MASTHTAIQQDQEAATGITYKNTVTRVNVGQSERWFSAISGGVLITYGVARWDWPGAALAALGGALLYRGATGHSFLYQGLDIVTVERSPSSLSNIPGKRGIRIRHRMTINRPAEPLYTFWRDVENAPQFMEFIETAQETGPRTSHWVGKGPFDKTVEWNAEILQDIPNQLISWHTHGEAVTGSAGKVSFEPASNGRGTVVTLEADFPQLSGTLGTSLGKIVGHIPEQIVQKNLRQFKALMETGEISTIKGQPTGVGRK